MNRFKNTTNWQLQIPIWLYAISFFFYTTPDAKNGVVYPNTTPTAKQEDRTNSTTTSEGTKERK
jgi:hypothetical protein